ncbi:conserved hypothetical protein [Coraliomargarita akajimensis DSM 45221]|uniref:Uncharacterized protein n=2 Tax=Coraliomargarita TaxID=442430 RepID=D5EIP8_CORAD|nr:conserved hypothetical protein [Coraliomargarita akajimensis DSM 45221]
MDIRQLFCKLPFIDSINTSMQTKLTLLSALAGLTLTVQSFAQMGPPMQPGEQRTTIEAVTIQTLPSDLENGGDFSIQNYSLRMGSRWGLSGGSSFGAGIGYGYQSYDFSGGLAPWEQIHQFDIGVQYTHQFDRTQSLMLLPRIQSAMESGADFGNSLRYGGIAAYMKMFSPDLMLGFGGAVFAGQEEVSGFPVLFVYWKINDNWRISNPFRPGPSGRAGLEVVYTPLRSWELALGGAYRNERFALDDSGIAPDGYGENSGTALFLRSTHRLGKQNTLDLYLATTVGGELTIDDDSGSKLASEEYDPNIILALAYSLRF